MDRRALVLLAGFGALAYFAFAARGAFASDGGELEYGAPDWWPGLLPATDAPPYAARPVSFDPVTGDPVYFDPPAFDAAPIGGSGSGGGGGGYDSMNSSEAMLATIRAFESNGDYQALYGSTAKRPLRFFDFSRHPFDGKPLPKHSAAGAYQFIIATWKRIQNKLGLPDFSPASQDAAAAELLRERGAIAALDRGDLPAAFKAASVEWASLPYSTAGQNPRTLDAALQTYNSYMSA